MRRKIRAAGTQIGLRLLPPSWARPPIRAELSCRPRNEFRRLEFLRIRDAKNASEGYLRQAPNGPDLIGLELRNKKAVLTFDRNCELLDCGRVSFSLAAGFDGPHVLDLPASDDVRGPANSHGHSVIKTSIRANGCVGEHRQLSVGYIRRKPPPGRRHHQRSTCELLT